MVMTPPPTWCMDKYSRVVVSGSICLVYNMWGNKHFGVVVKQWWVYSTLTLDLFDFSNDTWKVRIPTMSEQNPCSGFRRTKNSDISTVSPARHNQVDTDRWAFNTAHPPALILIQWICALILISISISMNMNISINTAHLMNTHSGLFPHRNL